MTNRSKAEAGAESEGTMKFVPQDDYVRTLHAVTQHWHSDVKFFEDELNFFRLLIDKHLALLIDPNNVQKTRSTISRINNLEGKRVALDHGIDLHTQHLAELVKDPFVQKHPDYNEEHAKLELEFQAFVKEFRSLKGEVFKLTENVIHSDRMRRLVDWA